VPPSNYSRNVPITGIPVVEPEQYEYFKGEWKQTDPNYAVTYHYYGTAKGYKHGTWTVFTSVSVRTSGVPGIASEQKLKWIRLKNFDNPLKARAYMNKRT